MRGIPTATCLCINEEGKGISNASLDIVKNSLHPASKDTAPVLRVLVQHHLIPAFFKPGPVVLLSRGEARTEARQSIEDFVSPFATRYSAAAFLALAQLVQRI